MDFNLIKKAAENYQPQMVKFLRDLIAIPGESCTEKEVVKRIEQEMKELQFDKVVIDPMGNILG
ncbi:MAG: peptidase, partial [Anaerocolumna sp.]|nr:peptidase [Anaerocolumna sp.]